MRNFSWTPSDFGLTPAGLEPLKVNNPQESAAMIGEVLAGARGPARDIVVLNAAAALWTAGRSETPRECAEMAANAIDLGTAAELLKCLVQLSNQ